MNRIKELRKQLKMSQRQLAEAAGVSQQQIQRIEAEKSNTTFEVIKKISTALGQTKIRDVFPDSLDEFASRERQVFTRQQIEKDLGLVARALEDREIHFVPSYLTVRIHLVGSRSFEFKLSEREHSRLYQMIKEHNPNDRFVVFDTPQIRVALRVAHVVSAQFFYDELTTPQEPETLQQVSYEKVSVVSPEIRHPLLLEANPDCKSLDDDFAESWEVQLQDAFFWAEQGDDECPPPALSFSDSHSISIVRLDQVSVFSVPHELIDAENFEVSESRPEFREE